ncbi:MAG TPA: sigma 54-interacting transcriptional regulator [Myxococcaceae bacterium]|nr:sigma 54-interacting transcriptional regulator [Myxococcaceae bacterium]
MTAATLQPVDLARDLQELATLVGSEQAVDDVLRRGLDWLARVAPYDLATVFVLEQGRLVVRAARGPLADDRVRQHALSLDQFPSVREAMETRRARTFLEADHRHGDGDPFDHVLDLPPGHACLVAPLVAGDSTLGVLTLDRTVCEVYPPPVVNLVEVYAQLLAMAIQGAGKTVTLERLHLQDHAHAKLLEEELGGGREPESQVRSPAMHALLRRARQVARAQTPVLIRGEPGSGKERLARAIHVWSARADHPFVSLSCAGVPEPTLELELFGHVEGAFAGAGRARPGRLVVANGGTLFLDEVSELPLSLQTRLLRVLQDGEFEAVGSDRAVRVDVRILAATHADLESAVSAGRFREDLFYLLDVFPLELPPLRERREDVAPLAEALLEELARRTGKLARRLTAEALSRLEGHDWPGNVRELANVLERALILAPGRELGPEVIDLPGRRRREARVREGELPTLADATRQHISRVLQATRGRIYGPGGAAEILGVKPSTLQSKMKKLKIDRLPPGPR